MTERFLTVYRTTTERIRVSADELCEYLGVDEPVTDAELADYLSDNPPDGEFFAGAAVTSESFEVTTQVGRSA